MTTPPTIKKAMLSALVLISAVATVPVSRADNNCTPYTASFRIEGSSPFGPLNGGGIYVVGTQPPTPAQVAAVLHGSAKFDPTAPTSEITFSSMALFAPGPDGVLNILTGIDKSVATAIGPGVFSGTTKSRITGGTGMFQDVGGKANSTSLVTVDLTTGHTVADINVQGRICGIGEAKDD